MMGENDYALIVGITRYPSLSDLSGPVNDAKSFQKWLLDRGNVPKKNIHLIVTPDNAATMRRKNARPVRDQVVNALLDILDNENERGKVGRRLYLYLAGHGYANQVNDAALLMANAGGRSYPAVPGAQFANWFRAAAKFQEIVLIMDCCRDDFGAIPPQPLPWPEENSPDAANVKYFHAFAAQAYRKAREQLLPPDGTVRGIFTHALITALELAVPEPDGSITGAAVKNYVLNYIRTVMKMAYQEPEIPIDSEKDIIFWKPQTIREQVIEFHFSAACRGNFRIIDGNLEIVCQGATPAHGPFRHPLAPGKYRIDADDRSFGKRFDVIGSLEEVVRVDI